MFQNHPDILKKAKVIEDSSLFFHQALQAIRFQNNMIILAEKEQTNIIMRYYDQLKLTKTNALHINNVYGIPLNRKMNKEYKPKLIKL